MIDSHAHLDDKAFNKDLEEVVKRCKERLKVVIDPATSLAANEKIKSISVKYSGFVFPAFGLDPMHSHEDIEKATEFIIENQKQSIAIGEVGLDYYWLKEKEEQAQVFKHFIQLANELGKPLIIHARNSEEDVIKMLEKHAGTTVIMHHFAGSVDQMFRCVDNGFLISLATNLCYAKSKDLIRRTPLENLLMETDSPYNHPERKGRNEPLNVFKLLSITANEREINKKELEEVVDKNAFKVFKFKVV